MTSSKFYSVCFMLLACVLSLGFTSCGGDDDSGGSSSKKVDKVVATLSYSFSSDLLSIADVKIAYTDASGATQTDTLHNKTWTKSITYTTFPAKVSATVTATRKINPGAKPSYSFAWSSNSILIGYYTDGTVAQSKKYSTDQTLTVSDDNLDKFFGSTHTYGSFATTISLSSDKTSFNFSE